MVEGQFVLRIKVKKEFGVEEEREKISQMSLIMRGNRMIYKQGVKIKQGVVGIGQNFDFF